LSAREGEIVGKRRGRKRTDKGRITHVVCDFFLDDPVERQRDLDHVPVFHVAKAAGRLGLFGRLVRRLLIFRAETESVEVEESSL
jgi:hypothetical protein